VTRLAPSFGGINLEDISAPRCFEIEDRLRRRLNIPVFHDDQHGTAVVVLAALRNAARVTGREIGDLRVVVSGAGAAGVACTRILLAAGIGDVAVADSRGILSPGRSGLTDVKAEMAGITNRAGLVGSLEDALVGADVFLGVSSGLLAEEAVAAMAPNSIIFALANPGPRWRQTSPTGTRASMPRVAATIRIRSTTCWPSPAFSLGRSTAVRARSPRV
jgi:malate dehydrogenase (oxaloacetate-decarboxylating)